MMGPAKATSAHERRARVVGTVGGVLGVVFGLALLGVAVTGLFFLTSRIPELVWIAVPGAAFVSLLSVAVVLFGGFAIRDAHKTRRGGAAGRLWLLLGIATAIGVGLLSDQWNPGFAALTVMSAVTTGVNFAAWRLRADSSRARP